MPLDYDIVDGPFTALTAPFHERTFLLSGASPSTGGTFTMTVSGQTATGLAFDITIAALTTALEALSNVAPGDVTITVTQNGPTLATASTIYQLSWSGGAFQDVDPTVTIDTSGLTGGTPHSLVEVIRQTISVTGGPGTSPKGILLSMAAATALDTNTAICRTTSGMAAGSQQRCVGYWGQNNQSAGSAGTGWTNDNGAILLLPGISGVAPTARAEVVGLAADSVIIDWTRKPVQNWLGRVRLYFGADMQCNVTSFASSATQDATTSTTAPGFQPDGIIAMSVNQPFSAVDQYGNDADGSMLSIGFYGRSSSTHGVGVVVAEHNESKTSSGAYVRNNRIAVRLRSISKTVDATGQIEVTSTGASGFTVTTRDAASALDCCYFSFAVTGGIQVWAGAPSLVTSSTGAHSDTSFGFRASSLLVVGLRTGGLDTFNSGAGGGAITIGRGDAAGHQGSISGVFRDNQTTSSSRSAVSNTYIADLLLTTTTRDYRWSLTNFTATGFDYNVGASSTADRVTPLMAIQERPQALLPTGIAPTVAFGTAVVNTTITVSPTGIAPTAAFGTAVVTAQAGAVTLSPTGIAPTAAFGTAVVSSAITLSPTGIAPTAAFGTAVVSSAITLSPTGIAPTATFGTSVVTPGVVTLSPTGIAPTAAFGTAVVSNTITSVGMTRGSARASAVTARIRVAVAVTRGSARASAITTRTRATVAVTRGSARASAVTARIRVAVAVTRGSARLAAITTRTKFVTAVARGQAYSIGTASVAATPSVGTTRGTSRASATTARIRVAVGATYGSARVSVIATRIRTATAKTRGATLLSTVTARTKTASAVSHGFAFATATTERIKVATAIAFGSSRIAVATVRQRVSSVESRGSARTNTIGIRARTASGWASGSSRSYAATQAEQRVTGVVQGSSRVVGSTTRARTGVGIVRGQARIVATAARVVTIVGYVGASSRALAASSRLKLAVGSSFGIARAEVDGVRERVAAAVARGSARSVGAVETLRSTAGLTRGSSRGSALAARALTAVGIVRGSARVVLRFGQRTAIGLGRGSGRARAWATTVTTCVAVDTAFDSRIRPRALALLERLGRNVVFELFSSRAYDTVTGASTESGTTQVMRRASSPLSLTERWKGGDTTRVGDSFLVVADDGLGFDPSVFSDVSVDGGRWTIESTKAIRSGNLVAAWVVYLTGSRPPRVSLTSVQGALDVRMPQTAKRLVTKYGKHVVFLVPSARLHDVEVGVVDDVGTCEKCMQVVFEPENIQRSSASVRGVLYALNLGFDPFVGMIARFDGDEYKIGSIESVFSGGLIAAWLLGFEM